MDDDYYSQSPSQSNSLPMSPSPPSSPPLAARETEEAVTIAPRPIQHKRPSTAAAAGAREDCWSEGATSALIDAWAERYLELDRGSLRQNHWQDVADIVNSRDDYTKPPKTHSQCKNRIDTLKKRYKNEKSKTSSSSSWPFFDRLDILIGSNQNPTRPLPPPLPRANTYTTRAAAAAAAKPSQAPFPQRLRTHHPSQHNSKKRPPSTSSAESSEGFRPERANGRKRQRQWTEEEIPTGAGRKKGLQELTRAIARFVDIYEQVESSKLKQKVELEKQRMEFAQELELQRMQFFMKTQVELSQLKHRHHYCGDGGKRKRASEGTGDNSCSSS